MTVPADNETWLIDRGDEIIVKEADCGRDALSAWEKLVYCVWVADYSIRNAGDLQTAEDVHNGCRDELLLLAAQLRLGKTSEAFALGDDAVVREYYVRFEGICAEIRGAEPMDLRQR